MSFLLTTVVSLSSWVGLLSLCNSSWRVIPAPTKYLLRRALADTSARSTFGRTLAQLMCFGALVIPFISLNGGRHHLRSGKIRAHHGIWLDKVTKSIFFTPSWGEHYHCLVWVKAPHFLASKGMWDQVKDGRNSQKEMCCLVSSSAQWTHGLREVFGQDLFWATNPGRKLQKSWPRQAQWSL